MVKLKSDKSKEDFVNGAKLILPYFDFGPTRLFHQQDDWFEASMSGIFKNVLVQNDNATVVLLGPSGRGT